jgi:hypothetical protein
MPGFLRAGIPLDRGKRWFIAMFYTEVFDWLRAGDAQEPVRQI